MLLFWSRPGSALTTSRFTFRKPSSISYEHQFSVHQKPKDDPNEKSARWRSIVTNIARFAEGSNVPPDTMILSASPSSLSTSCIEYLDPEYSNWAPHDSCNLGEVRVSRSCATTRSTLLPIL